MRYYFSSDLKKVQQICERYQVETADFTVPFTLRIIDGAQKLVIRGQFTYAHTYSDSDILYEKILSVEGAIAPDRLDLIQKAPEIDSTLKRILELYRERVGIPQSA